MLRVLANGLVLTLANIGGVVLGFVLFYRIPVAERIPFQLATAFAFTVLAFLAWRYLIARHAVCLSLRHGDGYGLPNEFVLAFLAAPLLVVVVFVPVHYVISGYVTSFANLVCAWGFQLPANALALLIASRICKRPDISEA